MPINTPSEIVSAFVMEFWQLSSCYVNIDFVTTSPVEWSFRIPVCKCCMKRQDIESLGLQDQFLVT